MASKSVLVSCVVLRFLTLGALVAAIVVLVTNQFRSDIDGRKTTFKDIIAYRYVLAVAGIGCLYTLIQLPFALYYAYKGKRLFQFDFLPDLDFYGDKTVAFLLATGTGAGFAVTLELKRRIKESFNAFGITVILGIDDDDSKQIKFLNRAYISCGLLLIGFACMVILSVLSSLHKSRKSGFFG